LGKRHKDPQNIPNGLKASRTSLSRSEITKETPPRVKIINQIPSKVQYLGKTSLQVQGIKATPLRIVKKIPLGVDETPLWVESVQLP